MKEITVEALKESLDNKEDFILVDVREQHERNAAHIGGEHLALSNFQNTYQSLDKNSKIVVYCRSGARSASVVQFLTSNGYSDVFNLKGGILAWKEKFAPELKIS